MKCNRGSDKDTQCLNCARLDFDCTAVGPGDMYSPAPRDSNPSLGASYTLAGTARKRAPRACIACHGQKARCTAEQPSCKRCVDRGFKCEYAASKRKVMGAVSLSPAESSSSSHKRESSAVLDEPPRSVGPPGQSIAQPATLSTEE